MGRVIRPVPASRQRKGWMKELRAAADRAGEAADDEMPSLLRYAADHLALIAASVESTAEAWEKRQYWVKADRFRHEWRWCSQRRDEIQRALNAGSEAAGRQAFNALQQHLQSVTPSTQTAREQPWSSHREG